MKFAWIKENCDKYSVAAMCRVLQVSRSGYYKSRIAIPGPRSQRSRRIREAVKEQYVASNEIYGSYKIAKELKKNTEIESACRNTVARAMREMGLKSRVTAKFTPQTTVTDPSKQPAENLLNQEFVATSPNQKWVTDITYLPLPGGWCYFAAVVDLFSRRVVGWSISESLATPLVQDALRDAIQRRQPKTQSLMHHSDRGCQYTSNEYQQTLATLGITCSMSRRGCCYDNAVMERFFWSLKHEWTKFESFADIEEARASVFRYIETFYNTTRIHQTLGYLSPEQFEREFHNAMAI